jgi:stress response protein YsnF
MRHDTSPSKEGRPLPLSAQWGATSPAPARTWTVRLPVRAEQVTVGKQVVVAEEVRLRIDTTQRTMVVERPVRRERLRVEVDGDVTADQRKERRI